MFILECYSTALFFCMAMMTSHVVVNKFSMCSSPAGRPLCNVGKIVFFPFLFILILASGCTKSDGVTKTKPSEVFDPLLDWRGPAWSKSAVIYQITPYKFTDAGDFNSITEKLEQLKNLGINTIFLQPVYQTHDGYQGYDITDYFSVRSDLGTPDELRSLITTAKSLGLRVIFDFVANHTSIHHPYAESIKSEGTASPYYDYYQHNFDGVMYSSHYNRDAHDFVYYFWEDLVNLNYDNEDVQQWMIDACKYWVEEYDIDGYRFDAIWGVNARKPSFASELGQALRSIKPDIFLLAEDKPSTATLESGFDAAYDWTMDTSWVSQWSWEYDYHENESRTIFNFPDVARRAEMLRRVIFANADKPVLRFMENNDLPRFGVHHHPQQTRMVAALLLSLPGIPMLYNGQETGAKAHPYSADPVFKATETIRSHDPELYDYYQNLIRLRKEFFALQQGSIRNVSVSPSTVFAFHRSFENEDFIVIMNLNSAQAEVSVDLSDVVAQQHKHWVDVITDEQFPLHTADSQASITLPGYSTRWMRLVE